MELIYPVYAVLIACGALLLGAGELLFLQVKPVAVMSWLIGWCISMSLVFSAPLSAAFHVAISICLTVPYVVVAYVFWRKLV
jgi:hypothetical protein